MNVVTPANRNTDKYSAPGPSALPVTYATKIPTTTENTNQSASSLPIAGGPLFITVVNHLVIGTDGSRRALPGTLPAFVTEILKPEINGPVLCKGEIRGYHGRLEPGSQERIEHDIPDAAHLSETGP